MECQKNGCNYEAMDTCKYCHKGFCSSHIKANKPSSPGLNSEHYIPPPLYGHACAAYLGSSRPNRYSPREHQSSTSSYTTNSNPSKKTALIVGIVLIIVILGIIVAYSNNHALSSNSLGNFGSNSTLNYIQNLARNASSELSGNLSQNNKTSSVQVIPIENLIRNYSDYLNKTVTAQGLLININAQDQVPGSYTLFNNQGEGVQVILPEGTIFQNRTNYTITGVYSLYNVPPALWNDYCNCYKIYYINGLSKEVTSSQTPQPMTNSSASGNLVFCINRGIFRTSDSRGLNESQVQNLVAYCEYYNYNPGVVNGTNYTQICQGVNECQMGGPPIQ